MLRRFALLLLACTALLGTAQLADDRTIATATQPPTSPTIALKLGSQGDRVKTLQSHLQKLGFFSGAIDGTFGESTKIAVEAFQRSAGLTPDGFVGATTWEQIEIAAMTPPATPQPQSPPSSPSPPDAAIEPQVSPVSKLPLILLGSLGAGGILGALSFRFRKPPARKAPEDNSASQLQPDPPNRVEQPLNLNGATSTNGHSDRALETTLQETTLQETTRLPKSALAAELLKDLHSSDPVLRRKAIWELGQRGESQAIQPLVDLMLDSDSQQRSLILAAIAEIGSRTLKPMQRALMISLQDESADVRKNAIRDLTRIYDSIAQTSQLLAHAANDADVEVQETARWALNQLNRIRITPEIEDAAILLQNSASESVLGDRSTSPQ